MSAAKVESIHIASLARAPVAAVSEAILVAGRGIVGDRYFDRRGTFSDWPQDHEFTLIEAEAIEAVEAEYGLSLLPGETRRNVTTRGISLNALEGEFFRIGETVLCRGTRLCHPCAHLELVTAKGGLARLLANRGGLRAHILVGGIIRAGDTVELFDRSEGIRRLAASTDAAYNTEQ
ncbi:MAG: MOSC domain-containing protein [Armatimonadota bacterium]